MTVRSGRVSFRSVRVAVLVCVAVVSFFVAIQLLSASLQTLSSVVRPILSRQTGPLSYVGTSWLSAYVMLNGSIVAAIALSLFSADLITVLELFLLVSGSRLGAPGIVLLIGALEFLRAPSYSLPEAMRLGTLTFLVSLTVYAPATVIGAVVIWVTERSTWARDVPVDGRAGGVSLFEPLTTATIDQLGAALSALVAMLVLVGSFHLLDTLLNRISVDWLREHMFVFLQHRWLSLGLGFAVTAVTTSVAFSMGVIVPIYNRGYIRRDEIVPYVMGASLGTLTDTLLVALILESGTGIAIVLLLFGAAAVSTIAALSVYDAYYAFLEAVQNALLENNRTFAVFVAMLVAVPFALVVGPG
ncbi:hypothetical protein [Natrinema altunense]|uniref:Sodium:phosphate symporter n=1 Tax=Natrinema altunense TaxID=222984 RepID=A0A482XUQ0_9EURY|nr:hypothetical protein [Natrinema altunense]RZH66462.1 hypothetical protein ELS17_17450 [Natrinema altunense]